MKHRFENSELNDFQRIPYKPKRKRDKKDKSLSTISYLLLILGFLVMVWGFYSLFSILFNA